MFFRIFFIVIFMGCSLMSCGQVESSGQTRYRADRENRTGQIDDEWKTDTEEKTITDSPETIADKLYKKLRTILSKLSECKSSTHGVPRNSTDILTGMFGITLPTQQARECLSQNLEKASHQICESQRELDEHLRKYDNYDYRRERLLRAIERVRRMEYKYKDRLFDMADSMRKAVDKKRRNGFANFLLEEEALAYESIFEEEAYTDCYAYFNYESNRSNRNRRY